MNLTKTILSVVQDIRSSSLTHILLGVVDDNDDVVIEADKTRIIQIYQKDDDEITISVEKKDKSINVAGGEVIVSIKDKGPGIDSNTLPKLFSGCALTPSSKAAGNGLGLFISKSIVEAHGGKIWAEKCI